MLLTHLPLPLFLTMLSLRFTTHCSALIVVYRNRQEETSNSGSLKYGRHMWQFKMQYCGIQMTPCDFSVVWRCNILWCIGISSSSHSNAKQSDGRSGSFRHVNQVHFFVYIWLEGDEQQPKAAHAMSNVQTLQCWRAKWGQGFIVFLRKLRVSLAVIPVLRVSGSWCDLPQSSSEAH